MQCDDRTISCIASYSGRKNGLTDPIAVTEVVYLLFMIFKLYVVVSDCILRFLISPFRSTLTACCC